VLINEILMEAMTYGEAIKVFIGSGIDPDDLRTPERLKKARNALAFKYHSDMTGQGDDAIKLINAAYDVLKDRPAPATDANKPDVDTYEPWAQAGWSGGMRNSSSIHRNDYTDVNFIKKRMWELSDHSREEWSIMGFDGNFMRANTTVYGSPKIFDEMAKAMVTWQTKGSNSYDCRAVIVSKRGSHKYYLIWADDKSYANDPIELESDSFNENPSNDRSLGPRLRKLIDDMQENGGRLPDQPELGVAGYSQHREAIDVGDRVEHKKLGSGTVINTSPKKGMTRVAFADGTRNVKSDSLRKMKRHNSGMYF
jgi:hypothetical protein